MPKSRSEINRDYYQKKMEESKGGYSQYLEDKKQKQLKLTLSLEEYEAIQKYCEKEGIKAQKYILGLIREHLGIGEGGIKNP